MTVESAFERAMLAADLSEIIDFDEEQWEALCDLAIAEGKACCIGVVFALQSRCRAQHAIF